MTTIGNRRNNCKHLLKRNHLFFTIDHVDITSIGDYYYFCLILVSVVIFLRILNTFEWLFLNYFFVHVLSTLPNTTSPPRPARYVFRWPPLDGRIYIRQRSPAIPYFQVFSREWPTYSVRVPGAIGGRFMDPNGG